MYFSKCYKIVNLNKTVMKNRFLSAVKSITLKEVILTLLSAVVFPKLLQIKFKDLISIA